MTALSRDLSVHSYSFLFLVCSTRVSTLTLPIVKMVLKRKRSESELSFSSTFSSPPRPGSSAFDFSAMETESWGFLTSRSSTPSHLPSRTMKRFRDNRPSEAEVHRTYYCQLWPGHRLTRRCLRTHSQSPLFGPAAAIVDHWQTATSPCHAHTMPECNDCSPQPPATFFAQLLGASCHD